LIFEKLIQAVFSLIFIRIKVNQFGSHLDQIFLIFISSLY